MSGGDTGQAKADADRSPLGLYVHVPFCASACDFCAFYQSVPTAGSIRRFLDGVEAEEALVGPTRRIDTVFWGGGTPGLLAPRDLERLADLVRQWIGASRECPDAAPAAGSPGAAPVAPLNVEGRGGCALRDRTGRLEWTVELAPGSVTPARLAVLREAGVTRVSMGVQSFQPRLIEALGRRHTPAQVRRAYDRIRAAGFESVNLDLMFALPGQSEAEWIADLREAVALDPDHLSTYCLTFEEDTRLWVELSKGRVKLDPGREAKLYRTTWAELENAGFAQYEISNFARPGHRCMHNLNTWRMCEWIGLGPSAASQHGGFRGANVADLDRWLAGLEAGDRMSEDRIELTAELLAEDALVFGLRMNDGVDLETWRRRAASAPWHSVETAIAGLVGNALAVRDGTRVRLTERGRLVADSVAAEILRAFEPVPTSV